MSKWKKLVTAVTAGCLVVTGFSAGGASAEPVAPAVAPVVAQPEHQPFKVLSYNAKVYGGADKVPMATRRLQLFALVKHNDPDIFVILEAEHFVAGEKRVIQDMPADFIKEFGGEYAYYIGPTNVPDSFEQRRYNTKLIFFRKERFRLATVGDAQGIVPVTNPYRINEKVGAAECWSIGERRYLAYVKLQDLQSKRSYFVTAMHPTHQKECFEGRNQYRAVLQTTIETKALPTGLSVIAMGDMNTDWECAGCNPNDNDLISRIEGGGAKYNLYRSDRHSAPTTARDGTMNTSWENKDANGNPKTVIAPRTIHYIFHSGGDMTMSDPKVDSGKYLIGTATDTPSDHYAISAWVQPSVFATEGTLDNSGSGADPRTKVYFTRVNADTCADKVTWNPALNKGVTTIALSNCNGTFKAPFNDTVRDESPITEFYFADVNGDSCADKISWNPGVLSGQIRVFLSDCDGKGTYKQVINSTNTASASAAANHYFAKVNADACEDLIYWNRGSGSGQTKVFLSDCKGTFKSAVSDTAGASSTSATAAFFFADVTGDGLADKIAWDPAASSGPTVVYKSAGNGTFSLLPGQISGGGSESSATQFFFADVTGDKKADKLVWRSDLKKGRILIFSGTGTGFSNEAVMDNTGFSEASDTLFSFADIDGSGASDKVYWNSKVNGGRTVVYLARFISGTVPATPVIGIATAGNASAVARWTAPANGGQAILGYHVRVVDAATGTKVIALRDTTAAALSLTITGLANGAPVKIQVQAWNAKGWGAASAYSNAVIPRL